METQPQQAFMLGHLTWGLENPMESQFVCIVLEGAMRLVSKPPSHQKEPMTMVMINQMTDISSSWGRGGELHHLQAS